MSDRGHILVLGGGVIGVTSAYYLARRGFRVTLIEAQPGVALETSFANGGLLTPSMSDPWAAPGLPWKILRWYGREDSPFLVRAGALPGLVSWGLSFLRNCNQATWRRNTATILRLASYSLRVTQTLTREAGITYDRSSIGTLRLFRDPVSMAGALRTAEVLGELGVSYRKLDAEACAELEPALAPQLRQITGGIHYPEDESGDAHLFTQRLAEACAAEGVAFRFGESVRGIELRDGAISGVLTDAGRLDAERCLVALGTGSVPLLRRLGIKLPIYPVKGYSVTFSTGGWNGAPMMPTVDDGRKIGVVRLGNRIRVAGTAEFAGYDTTLTPRRGANLIGRFMEMFPDFPNQDSARHWTGLRPMTPDGIPFLGPTSIGNLYVNTGHGHLGWTMACGSAKAVADLIAGEPPDIDLSGITPDGR
ncbi:MAG: D-amino acid dehydrogenase [Proteobacteria bacterium]|nr:D-amino acid dehydrogenase [Pseudomonadota bacterium]